MTYDICHEAAVDLATLSRDLAHTIERLAQKGPHLKFYHFGHPLADNTTWLYDHIFISYNRKRDGSPKPIFPTHIIEGIKEALDLTLKYNPPFEILVHKVYCDDSTVFRFYWKAEQRMEGAGDCFRALSRGVCWAMGREVIHVVEDENIFQALQRWNDKGAAKRVRFDKAFVKLADAVERLHRIETRMDKFLKERRREME